MDTCVNMEAFRRALVQEINSCNLSIGAAYYILKDVCKMLEASYQETLEKELKTATTTVETEVVDLVPNEEEVTENVENND